MTARDIKKYEQPKKYLLLPEPFSAANDMLTPKLSIRKPNVIKAYKEAILGLYDLPDDAVCLFFKPRVLAYFGERRSAGFQVGGNSPEQLLGFVVEGLVRRTRAGGGMRAVSAGRAPLRRLMGMRRWRGRSWRQQRHST